MTDLYCPICKQVLKQLPNPDPISSAYIGYQCNCDGHWLYNKGTMNWYLWESISKYVGHYVDAKKYPVGRFQFR